MNKRKFKGTKISVKESLISLRMTKLKDARDEYGFNEVWISDARIKLMEEGSYSSNNIWMTYESMIVLRFILWKKT